MGKLHLEVVTPDETGIYPMTPNDLVECFNFKEDLIPENFHLVKKISYNSSSSGFGTTQNDGDTFYEIHLNKYLITSKNVEIMKNYFNYLLLEDKSKSIKEVYPEMFV